MEYKNVQELCNAITGNLSQFRQMGLRYDMIESLYLNQEIEYITKSTLNRTKHYHFRYIACYDKSSGESINNNLFEECTMPVSQQEGKLIRFKHTVFPLQQYSLIPPPIDMLCHVASEVASRKLIQAPYLDLDGNFHNMTKKSKRQRRIFQRCQCNG